MNTVFINRQYKLKVRKGSKDIPAKATDRSERGMQCEKKR